MKKFISYDFPIVKGKDQITKDSHIYETKERTFYYINTTVMISENQEVIITVCEDYDEGKETGCSVVDIDGIVLVVPAKKSSVINYLNNPEKPLEIESDYYTKLKLKIEE